MICGAKKDTGDAAPKDRGFQVPKDLNAPDQRSHKYHTTMTVMAAKVVAGPHCSQHGGGGWRPGLKPDLSRA